MVKIATGEAVAAARDDDGVYNKVYGYESIFIVLATLHTYPWQTHIWHQRARKLDFTAIFLGIASRDCEINLNGDATNKGDNHDRYLMVPQLMVCFIFSSKYSPSPSVPTMVSSLKTGS